MKCNTCGAYERRYGHQTNEIVIIAAVGR